MSLFSVSLEFLIILEIIFIYYDAIALRYIVQLYSDDPSVILV